MTFRHIAAAVLIGATAAATAPAAHAADSPWKKRRVLNIAHQGGENEFPSNTMFAFKRSLAVGADMLELDIGVTKDNQIVVMHDAAVDRTTNGKGLINDKTLKQIKKLDNAYWFKAGDSPYSHDRKAKDYKHRGIATGKVKAPKGFTKADFRVATLKEVLDAFPDVPINIEIKPRDHEETDAGYVANAEALAAFLKKNTKRTDIVVASFNQPGLDRFHQLLPKVALAPATSGAASYLLSDGSPGQGIEVFQMPITFNLGGTLFDVTTKENVAKAHADGYAWHVWDAEGNAVWNRMLDYCVDGIMTAQPKKLEKLLEKRKVKRPGTRGGTDPCA